MTERKIVIPGEVIVKGDDFLPGEGTARTDDGVVAMKFGLGEEVNKLVKVIPLSGVYQPRRGNVIIGEVEMVTHNGWIIKVSDSDSGFLSLTEVPKYVDKNEMEEIMDVGDVVVAKISGVNRRGVDLTIKLRGLGKIDEGVIMEANSNKVPRVIGREGSMIKLIKDETGCNITVGQNGLIWVKGDSIEQEIFAKEAIKFVTEKSFVSWLTEEIERWFKEKKGDKR